MAITPLTLYGSTVADSFLANACQMATTTGGAATNNNSKVGTAINFSEVTSQGTTTAWAAASSIGNPTGKGWLFDSTALENQQIVLGNWQPIVRLQTSVGSLVADIHVRAYVHSTGSGKYTLIADIVKANQTINTNNNTFTLPNTSVAATNFAVGDRLYIDVWLKVLSNSTGSGAATIKSFASTSATQGVANNMQVTTPGYQVPFPPLDNPYGYTSFVSTAGVVGRLSQIIADMQAQGASWLRLQLPQYLIDTVGASVPANQQQDPRTYTWTGLDNAVAQCNNANINLLFSIMFPPASGATDPSTLFPISTPTGYYTYAMPTGGSPANYYVPDPTKMAIFTLQVATRYNGGAHGTIQGIEPGNEEYCLAGNNAFQNVRDNGGTPAALAMTRAYNGGLTDGQGTTFAGFKTILPTGLLVAPSLLHQDVAGIQTWMSLYIAGGGLPVTDAMTFHLYKNGGSPPLGNGPENGNVGFTTFWRTMRDSMADNVVQIWCTECGYGTDNVDVAHQAQYLVQELESLRTSGGVGTKLMWYTIGNNDTKSLTQHGQVDGLTETYQPAYWVWQNYIYRNPQWNVPAALFPTTDRRTGAFPTTDRRTGIFPAADRRQS